MSRSCGIQLLARSRCVRKYFSTCTSLTRNLRTGSSVSAAPSIVDALLGLHFPKEQGQDFERQFTLREEWDRGKVTDAERFSNADKGTTTSYESDRGRHGSSGSCGVGRSPRENWYRDATSNAVQTVPEIWRRELCTGKHGSSDTRVAVTPKVGSLVNFSGNGLGCFTAGRRVAGVSYTLGNGLMSRSFSSAPAVVEGTRIALDGEQLDSLQTGLSAANDTASSVGSIANSGVSEVGLAAADCSVPTAFIQYVIDGVHVTTGLPWWLSIVATTFAIRILVLPLMVYQMKATSRLTLMRPELEKLTNHIKDSNYDPRVVEENQARMKALFIKHKTSPFSPILGAFIQAPLFMCFFFAIRNMAEKMDSFKEGGALWFTDLSTPDTLFILPVLSGAFFLLTVELGATDGMQGQPMMAKMKMFLRGLAVLLVPLTASFPKALFCYWLTANVCSIIQAAAFKQPGIKAALGIPDVSHLAKPADLPVMPVMTYSHPPRLKDAMKVSSSKDQRR